MTVINDMRQGLRTWLLGNDDLGLSPAQRELKDSINKYRAYARGDQDNPLIVAIGKPNDNTILNFCGLIVDRAISLLVGGGMVFDFEGDDVSKSEEYVTDVWTANKVDTLAHKCAFFGATSGTSYVKILPDTLNGLPKLQLVDPAYVTITTDPGDMDIVSKYTTVYMLDGVGHKEITRHEDDELWVIETYTKEKHNWVLVDAIEWHYKFPPIIHWQNLPDATAPYGRSDLADVIAVQDRLNFVASNIYKIIRLHAHPKTWGTGWGIRGAKKSLDTAIDKMMLTDNENAKLANLELESDLSASQGFLLGLRQAMMDMSRTVDITSISDKLGSLTNFGLRVLYQDVLAKLGTKRLLWADALTEINRRLLVLAELDSSDAGAVVWPSTVLPVDLKAEGESAQIDVGMGVVSKQTVSKNRGYDWVIEQERIAEEKVASVSIGTEILDQFDIGG